MKKTILLIVFLISSSILFSQEAFTDFTLGSDTKYTIKNKITRLGYNYDIKEDRNSLSVRSLNYESSIHCIFYDDGRLYEFWQVFYSEHYNTNTMFHNIKNTMIKSIPNLIYDTDHTTYFSFYNAGQYTYMFLDKNNSLIVKYKL